MYEYVLPVKEHTLKGVANKKRPNLNNMAVPYKGAAECLFDDARVHYKSDKSLPLQVPAYFQEKWGNMESKPEMFSGYEKDKLVQLKKNTDCNSSVVQFTVAGITGKEWLDAHKLSGKKRELFAKFFDMVHRQSDFIFFGHELDSYYEQYEKANYSNIDEKALQNFDLFKKHVAMIRDPEGAHGAQRHTHDPQAGNQYIVDRVSAPGGPKRASYLPVDTYLYWDNILIMNHEGIFSKYMELAKDLISWVLPIIHEYGNDVELLKNNVTGLNREACIDIKEFGKLTLSVSFIAHSITMEEDVLNMPVKASVISNQQVESIGITRKDADEQGILGVKKGTKNPEAHTGALAPVFRVKDDEIENAEDITSDMLKWVTKF